MEYNQIIEEGKKVVTLELKSIEKLINKIDNNFAKAVNAIYNSKGRVVISGVGKSGLIARKIVATLNSTGTAAISLHPTDALHGDLGMVRKDDIIVVISKSGDTDEIINLVTFLKRIDVTIIGMLGNTKSTLSRLCDIVLDISVDEEACPNDLAPTSSTTTTLVMGDALAVALIQIKEFTVENFAEFHPGGSLGKRLSLKISEIMYNGDDIPIVYETSLLKDIIYEISSKRLGTTAVLDSNKSLVGIITDGDLRRLLEKSINVNGITAKEIMSKEPKTIQPDFLASFALQQMEKFNITTLIVSENGKTVNGIVHLHDLVKLGLKRR